MDKFKFTKEDMVIEALDYYVYDLEKNNCNAISIAIFSELLEDFETGKLQVKESTN